MAALSLGAVFALGLVLAPACGGARTPKPWPEQQARRNEITVLWAQIRDWRREAGMEVEPEESAVMAMSRMTVSTAAKACVLQRAPTPACSDVCDLGDAICDNAESICGIADELDDAWAREKCDSAKASCREAQQRCCRCDKEPIPTAPSDTSSPSP
jgi:hypothetical protein